VASSTQRQDDEIVARLDALAKSLISGLPVAAVVTCSRTQGLTLDAWTMVPPGTAAQSQSSQLPQKRSWSIRYDQIAAADADVLERFVKVHLAEFLKATARP
jgi:hypothetical protein